MGVLRGADRRMWWGKGDRRPPPLDDQVICYKILKRNNVRKGNKTKYMHAYIETETPTQTLAWPPPRVKEGLEEGKNERTTNGADSSRQIISLVDGFSGCFTPIQWGILAKRFNV